MLALRKRHVPDLSGLQRLCETNYMGLMKLLPRSAWQSGSHGFEVEGGSRFQLQVRDEGRYTSVVEVRQRNEALPAYLRACLQVRLYHDARMAEVCMSQQISRLRPSYAYPNDNMHQPNEKEQCNLFLAEWLKFCLAHGYGTLELSQS